MDNEKKYKAIDKEILDEGQNDSNRDQNDGYSEEKEEKDKEGEKDEGQQMTIHDKMEISLVF